MSASPRCHFRLPPRLARRRFLALAASGLLGAAADRRLFAADAPARPARLFFTSQGKTAIVNADGSGLRYLEFDVPNQATWQPGPAFDDGHRVVMLSMEPRRDGPGKPFSEYYTKTPTHLWIYDLDDGSLKEICTKNRSAPFITPQLLVGRERILVQVVHGGVGQLINMRFDGSDARLFIEAEGLPYGLSLSPDGRRVAYHLASPLGYQVWTSDVEGENCLRVAADPDHLYFGTSWSPDGKSILYVDCHYQSDPGHDWCDVCVGRADGSEHRVLTSGQAMWFAATYGDPATKGGGSNVPAWTPSGEILFPRRSPGAGVAWEYQPARRDVDHFNRDFKPERAGGGAQIARLDPRTGRVVELTPAKEGVWDFRCSASPDGRQIVFCRAATGGPPAVWTMNADGSQPRELTRGLDNRGADHPRWIT